MKLSDLDPSEIKPVNTPTADAQAQPSQALQPTHAPLALSEIDPNEVSLVAQNEHEYKYGSIPEQAIGAAEGVAKAIITHPGVALAEKGLTSLGVPDLTPEDQEGRAQENPWIDFASQTVGLIGSAGLKFGVAPILETAGKGALELAGLGAAKTLGGRVGAGMLKDAVEMAVYQSGDEVAKKINNPDHTFGAAAGNVALASLIGLGAGGLFGTVSHLWQKDAGKAVKQGIGDFKNSMDGSVVDQAAQQPVKDIEEAGLTDFLKKQKENAPEIIQAAEDNGLPVLPGMTSDARSIRQSVDALLKSPPTVPALQMRKLYSDGYKAASDVVSKALGEGATPMSETQAGNAIRESLLDKLGAEKADNNALFDALEPYNSAIPLTDKSTGSLSRNIENIIEEQGVIKNTGRYNFVKTMADGIKDIDNLNKLKNFKTQMSKSAIESGSKDLAADISERLNGVRDRAIKRFADGMKTSEAKDKILSLIDDQAKANATYAKFRDKLETLGASLGKKKIYGPQDFIDFVSELNPQTLARRIFNDNNTEFASYFAKEFPDEMNILRGYQKGAIAADASPKGVFQPTKALKAISDMEPEMLDILFNDAQKKKFSQVKTYIDAFPESFNPSGTDHESAFRAFFEKPTGASLALVRDFGLQTFIKLFDRASPGASAEAGRLLPIMGKAVQDKEANPTAFKQSVEYLHNAIKGDYFISKAAKSIFKSGELAGSSVLIDEHEAKHLDKKLKEFQKNDTALEGVGGEMGHYLPNHAIALKAATANAVGYLNSLRPVVPKLAPLDPDLEPPEDQTSAYHRALMIANKPLSLVELLKQGQLTPQDVQTAKIVQPQAFAQLTDKVSHEMINNQAKGNVVPAHIRAGLSTLLGYPVDSSQQPQRIQANQAVYAHNTVSQETQAPQGKPPHASLTGMRQMKVKDRISLNPSDNAE